MTPSIQRLKRASNYLSKQLFGESQERQSVLLAPPPGRNMQKAMFSCDLCARTRRLQVINRIESNRANKWAEPLSGQLN